MSTRKDKLRGLFLAALMVFSVFGGTIAFAGGAAVAQTLDGGDATEPDSGVSTNDALVNATSGSTITIGYNASDVADADAALNVSVTDPDGQTTWYNQTTNANGTSDLVLPAGVLTNGETADLTANVVNTSTGTVNATDSSTVYTFGVDADNTTDQNVAADRNVEVADLNFSSSDVSSVVVNLNGTDASDLDTYEIQEITVTEDTNIRARVPTREALFAYRDVCREKDIPFRIQRIFEESAAAGDRYGITERQQEALTVALEEGYFDVPRETTLSAVAAKLDISAQALSARLRRGQANLLRNTIDEPAPT